MLFAELSQIVAGDDLKKYMLRMCILLCKLPIIEEYSANCLEREKTNLFYVLYNLSSTHLV